MNSMGWHRMAAFLALGVATCSCRTADAGEAAAPVEKPVMYYADTSHGGAFAKDPDVVRFGGRYFMYYSIRLPKGIGIGIAVSDDLNHWKKAGEFLSGSGRERKGVAAPAAIVLKGKVHLFYQSYGTGPKDAICHAVSKDGLHFERNTTNPIFAPKGGWTVGRAIDADVIPWGDQLLLYFATRDPKMKVQMLGVAAAPLDSDYGRGTWTQRCDAPILKPERPWEQKCIEAAAVCEHSGRLYMFYAGAYNNSPQQIGVAASDDGIVWARLSDSPLLPNGTATEWNASESGHPGIFTDDDGAMHLFFQGNNDDGKTWFLSRMRIEWEDALPHLVRPRDGKEFHLLEPKDSMPR